MILKIKLKVEDSRGRLSSYSFKALNRLRSSMTKWKMLIIGLLWCAQSAAQTSNPLFPSFADHDLVNPKAYILDTVRVIGAERRDDNAIKSITSLREGQTLVIPSSQITNAVKKLWRLGLFSDVSIVLDTLIEDRASISIILKEQPTLTRIVFNNMNKSKQDKLKERVDGILSVGRIVTDNDKIQSTEKVRDYFIEKGFLDTDVRVSEVMDSIRDNAVILVFDINTNDKVKIAEISFEGNNAFSDKKLRKALKETKKKGTIFKKSKYVSSSYEEDKKKLVEFYTKKGYSDATILKDSVYRDESGSIGIAFVIEEGVQYKFGNITWKGNSIYTDEQLSAVLGINKGEVFDPALLEKRLQFSLDGRDVSSLYLDYGYLFFNVDPKQVAIRADTIDLEMRIYEGPQATIDRVVIKGNDRTNEHVIRRAIRTKPGEKFSRSELVRSNREIVNLGYFDPESVQMNTPVNYERGTVDIEFTVEERPSDQLELSAGYGGFQGLIGTLGVTFNNFSIQNINKKESWSPLPTGDAQRFSVRLQSNSRFFRSYNASFTEPWLGGKKPNSFSIGAAATIMDQSQFGSGKLNITRVFAGLGSALRFPDDFFTSSTVVNIERIQLDNFFSQFVVNNGAFKNFNINQTFARSSIANPMFPMSGSRISLSIKFTPPYSLFRKKEFWKLSPAEREAVIGDENLNRGVRNKLVGEAAEQFIEQVEDGRKFSFLEYHKWRFDAEWFFNVTGKLVFMASTKMGFLGNYNSALGDVPFERFELGGDGLSNQNNGIMGVDIIALRGYEVADIDPLSRRTGGGTIFSKYTAELRYPLSTNPNSTIFTTLYFQGGNQWRSFRDYNPFDMRRAVGMGVRVFLPMFGLLGFDYAFGLDKTVDGNRNPSFGQLGKFSIVLGFEPD